MVDDQRDALVVLERILVSAGATVITASSAEAALAIVIQDRFDVILSDIAMPGMDGYEFVEELPRRGVHTPAIALTAFAFPTDVSRATAAGFQAHISKPIDRAALLAAISQLTNRTV